MLLPYVLVLANNQQLISKYLTVANRLFVHKAFLQIIAMQPGTFAARFSYCLKRLHIIYWTQFQN